MPAKKKWTIKVKGHTYSYTRNYKKEYRERTPAQKNNRSVRRDARSKLEKLYGKFALKNKDVDHIHGVKAGNAKSNLRVTSIKFNRSRKSLRWR